MSAWISGWLLWAPRSLLFYQQKVNDAGNVLCFPNKTKLFSPIYEKFKKMEASEAERITHLVAAA